jgi:hypothetical protein
LRSGHAAAGVFVTNVAKQQADSDSTEQSLPFPGECRRWQRLRPIF